MVNATGTDVGCVETGSGDTLIEFLTELVEVWR